MGNRKRPITAKYPLAGFLCFVERKLSQRTRDEKMHFTGSLSGNYRPVCISGTFNQNLNCLCPFQHSSLTTKIMDVTYFSAEEKLVTIHTRDGKTYLRDLPLKSLEEKLGDGFLRIHRSLLVNVSRIREINKHFNGCFILKIDDFVQTKLQSGSGYAEEVKRLLEI